MNLRARLARLESEEEAGVRRTAERASPRTGRPVADLTAEVRQIRASVRRGLAGSYPPDLIAAVLDAFAGGPLDLREVVDRHGIDWRQLARDTFMACGRSEEEVEAVLRRHEAERQPSYVGSSSGAADTPTPESSLVPFRR